MKKKHLKIFGLFLAFGLCFLIHFVYDKFPCLFTSIVAPVNESIWEHMKILFGSIILSGVVQKIIILVKKENDTNICISNFIGAVSSIPIFLIIYLPIYYTFGESFIVTIIIMFISLAIVEFVAYKIMMMKDLKLENVTIFLVMIIYIIFGVLTYYPLEVDLFLDPMTNNYGINK